MRKREGNPMLRSRPKHRWSRACHECAAREPVTLELEPRMITCIIRYHIDPSKKAEFEQYARNWGQAIPRCGGDLVGYFAPHEGSATLAYGVYSVESLAAYEQYRARLAAAPLGRENSSLAQP